MSFSQPCLNFIYDYTAWDAHYIFICIFQPWLSYGDIDAMNVKIHVIL